MERYAFIKNMREQGKTYKEIGEALGITGERVRQIEARCKRIEKRLDNQKTNG